MIHKKKIIIGLIFIGIICLFSNISNAAPVEISSSKTSVTEGESFTVTISSDYIGRIDLSTSGNITLSDNKVWVEKGSDTVTVTANGTGDFTITATPSELSDGQKDIENIGAKSVAGTVTAKKKEDQQSNKQNNTETATETKNVTENQQSKQEVSKPTFTEKNQTLYSTGEINVRSSYSTSSNVVGSLKKGDTIEVIGTSSNGWSKVKYNGKEAYIKTELLTETKPKEEKSTNKLLKSLKIEEANLNPEFDKDVTNYTLKIGKDVNSLKIEAVAEDDKSQVSISGNEDLKNGENTVKITVTAEDGTIRTYTITVTKDEKDESEKLKLASLKITGITFSDKFDPDKYEYKLNLNYKLEKLDIKAEANKADAKIEILGNDKLSIGENIITIMVKSKDESENITYQIIVNMQEGSENDNNTNLSKGNKNKTFLYITIGVFSISLLLIILIIVRGIRKSREEEFDEEYDNEDNDYSGYNYNNNYTEELYGIKNEKNKENNLNTTKSETDEFYENLQDTSREDNRLYDVEKEIDFSDIDKPNRKKGGKHSR